MTFSQPVLSLSDLELFDPRASGLIVGQGAGERRFLCPLCGEGKPRDGAHRSLCLNAGTGVWRCHRCGEGGKVREAWQERAPLARRERAHRALSQAFALPVGAAPVEVEAKENGGSWKRALRELRALSDTRGARYLGERGLSVETARGAGARFSRDFLGRPAVVFPLRDLSGNLRGAHGRYVDGCDRPKARTLGDKQGSLFSTGGALSPQLPALIVTEAPLDALSLAQAGYPSVAFCGTQAPTWFHRLCAFRRVLLAFDADEAGDCAADKLAPLLKSFGARPERLRPEGFTLGEDLKDWNEILLSGGRDALADWLAGRVLVEARP